MKRLGAAALWLVACQRAEPVAPIVLDLPEGIAARVGSDQIRVETVSRIASAEQVEPRVARDRAVYDALFAEEGRARLDPATVRAGTRAVEARALLEHLAAQARAGGPPSDAELDVLLRERWLEFDRPEAVVVVHAVALTPAGGKTEAAEKVGKELKEKLAGITDPNEFLRVAQEIHKGEITIRAERVPAICADTRGFHLGIAGAQSAGNFDSEFTRAAHALKQPGDQSPLVHTGFGYHVILLEDRLPERRVAREEARQQLFGDAVARRADREKRALVERLQAAGRIEVSRNFDALTAGLGPPP
jgi:hypothetical protein